MKINEVEALVGVTKKNIRFYEEKGLLSPRRNMENGYRDYGEMEVAELQRIKLLRKLGVPIDEIRRMQTGSQTVGDGMRRHLITLEREQQNLEHSIRLCTLLKEHTEPLSELDAAGILQEMTLLEQSGATFQNKQNQDTRILYVAPIVISVLFILLMGGFLSLFVWAYRMNPDGAPPQTFLLLFMTLPVIAACGVLLALYQRIKEIRKGEVDDAKQY